MTSPPGIVASSHDYILQDNLQVTPCSGNLKLLVIYAELGCSFPGYGFWRRPESHRWCQAQGAVSLCLLLSSISIWLKSEPVALSRPALSSVVLVRRSPIFCTKQSDLIFNGGWRRAARKPRESAFTLSYSECCHTTQRVTPDHISNAWISRPFLHMLCQIQREAINLPELIQSPPLGLPHSEGSQSNSPRFLSGSIDFGSDLRAPFFMEPSMVKKTSRKTLLVLEVQHVDYSHPGRPSSTMPVPTSTGPALDHQRRFQAAVNVIQNLPKNGCYHPSYAVMLRFYSLYKQAVCGPCTLARPGFWDPVGRYKWDAWSRLGELSSEGAMAAYVDEMKKVAKEVLDTMQVNEETALLIHHFEPLYQVVEDMPRPPPALLSLQSESGHGPMRSQVIRSCGPLVLVENGSRDGLKTSEDEEEEVDGGLDAPSLEMETLDLSTTPNNDSGLSEGPAPTSDSESEIFCDSLDSEEQLLYIKARLVKSTGVQNGDAGASAFQPGLHRTVAGATQVGSGKGGEGAGEDRGPPMRRRSHSGRDGSDQSRRERGPRAPGAPNMGGGGGGGGGGARGGGRDGPEGGAEWLHDSQLQQQIVVALRRLREDMRSVMERLEAVERLTAAHAQNEDWRLCSQCATSASTEEEKWWPFEVSGQTLLLLLLWPLVAQGVGVLLRRAQKRGCVSS
ncbi:Acyl-CoA-binding domain-containing protein 5 [Merluccius polli]|uniref:Acyl-CoA-binding domain-containing protein 5 n=1 Tax=Merluccius polli TaxID=89951 RepID=A0AA47N8H4_MERPO|nr:Acyl-CoA-binding domain-containing protein 5 [Merluccius polli]